MKNKALENLKWKIAEGFGIAPPLPGDILPSEPDLIDWLKPRGITVKNKLRRKPLKGRGSRKAPPKRVDKLYYRGSRSHHQINTHSAPKAYMPYRGKGAKIERRSARSRARRARG